MQTVNDGAITQCVDLFLGRKTTDAGFTHPTERAREYSWDFCFNYFQEHSHPTEAMEHSCMQLGYYLASWGMLRGSSYLFNKTNARHYMEAVELIEELNPVMVDIDANRWADPGAQEVLVDTYQRLRGSLLPKGVTAETLVTKVMLGVWGNVPAFDTYFRRTFRTLSTERHEPAAFNRFNARSLTLLGNFYQGHAHEIDALASTCRTRSFTTSEWTDRTVPRGKIVDMFGFQYTGWRAAHE